MNTPAKPLANPAAVYASGGSTSMRPASRVMISAASILAKVVRDRQMRAIADSYPNWSFDTNKGYPCPRHKSALRAYGPTSIHRRTLWGPPL